jgi:hypothetical protein
MALASRVRAGAINVWSFLHRFALGAAVLAGGDGTGTNGVSALFSVLGAGHVESPCELVFGFLKSSGQSSSGGGLKPYGNPII